MTALPPAAARPAPPPEAPRWSKDVLGWLNVRGTSYPLWFGGTNGNVQFTRLDARTQQDAVRAATELRRAESRGQRDVTETAVLQSKDGSYWASPRLSTYWKHKVPWWMPIGESVSHYRKETIDEAKFLGGPAATVTPRSTDLRALLGDRYGVVVPPGSDERTQLKPQKLAKLAAG